MAKKISFSKELDNILRDRTIWLKKTVGGKKYLGVPPKINKRKISKKIKYLQKLATDCVSDNFAKKEFTDIINKKKQWRVSKRKGRGWKSKKENFSDWFDANIDFQNCIYVFWNNSRCMYVGRTIKGKGRPQSHFNKIWFSRITRVDIFSTSRASEVSKLECLAKHRFNPKENVINPSIPKHSKKCNVCIIRKHIKSELSKIFSK